MRPARTETFEHTISGLLKKRADLFNEAERIRDRLSKALRKLKEDGRVLSAIDDKGNMMWKLP